VSRGGLLVACKEPHGEGFPLWVTFPFDPNAPEGQPEVLARVVRSHVVLGEGADRKEIALHFEGIAHSASATNGQKVSSPPRKGAGQNVSLPIRVRPKHIPWFEEAMTLEVSSDQLRFISTREYAPGDALFVTFVSPDARPWHGRGEILARIVNVEKLLHSSSLVITLVRLTE
jgi:hypothetical protein